ncbi:MAG: hypothetical protein KIS73_26915 [Enhydrobacter sp.]|nr:hypothetical protein [Enhydrobacter sp.]
MPVEFEIDHTERFVQVKAYGVVRLPEILDYFDALVVQDAMPYPKLFDARTAEPDLTDDDVMTLGARVSAYAALEPRGPIAAVAVTKKAGDILQRFMNLGGAPRPMRLFASVEEARSWLKASR